MAQIWGDQPYSPSHVIWDNKTQAIIFEWQYVTFAGEKQAMAEIRWRKAGVYPTLYDRISPNHNTWTGYAYVSGNNDVNKHIALPVGTLSEGVWFFDVRFKNVGEEGGDWSGWTTHRIEISEYDDRSVVVGTTATSHVKGPSWPVEGTYGTRVQVMSAAGILSPDSNEQQYEVWDTNKYLKLSNGDIVAVPENIKNGTLVGRARRSV